MRGYLPNIFQFFHFPETLLSEVSAKLKNLNDEANALGIDVPSQLIDMYTTIDKIMKGFYKSKIYEYVCDCDCACVCDFRQKLCMWMCGCDMWMCVCVFV